ncbi:MAG: hypothetical protein DRO99_02775 [Candidatus Aenigmatarchaeota archaeon]|nr:MAG: hypothetical protein DRO99_02775 [Candidatus Aenigmarchaeota archaeon]
MAEMTAEILSIVYTILPMIVQMLIILITAFVIYKIIAKALRKAVLEKAETKAQRSNAIVLLSLWRYAFVIVLVIGLIFYLGGDITGLGVWAGLFSAALGWALQKPITGIAGWIMVITKKPFQIGDRISIGSVKGDVVEIGITHIYLKEIGGTIKSEETSGRLIMIPNSTMFDKNIINYTLQDDYILDDVGVLITYESNLEKAIKICQDAADKIAKEGHVATKPKPPYVRTFFSGSGIDIKTRYYVKAEERIKTSSDITQEIFRGINKTKDVEIAYPHTEVVLRKKVKKK